jgi:hypothetical protein
MKESNQKAQDISDTNLETPRKKVNGRKERFEGSFESGFLV